MNDNNTTISVMKDMIYRFIAERNWVGQQNALSVAVSISLEAAELLEIFQWCDKNEADKFARETHREHFMEELADIMIYCMELATTYDVDIASAIEDKMRKNAKKYPVPNGEALTARDQ